MPSFDIVSQVDRQEVKNAVEQTNKEITNRFDFKGSDARVELNELALTVYADDEFKLGQVLDVLRTRLAKRNVDIRALESGAVEKISGDKVKRPVTVKVGVPQEKGKQIQKLIKDSKLKVAASIQGDAVRISGAKKDDLQSAIQLVKTIGRRSSPSVHQLPRLRPRSTGRRSGPRPGAGGPGAARCPCRSRPGGCTAGLFRCSPDLLGPALQPGAHQLRGHLDMALHGEVAPERERLVRAVLALEHARRARRDAEGLAVPLEGLERLQLAEPLARHAVVRARAPRPSRSRAPGSRAPCRRRRST